MRISTAIAGSLSKDNRDSQTHRSLRSKFDCLLAPAHIKR